MGSKEAAPKWVAKVVKAAMAIGREPSIVIIDRR
jgi:hypothetical protein